MITGDFRKWLSLGTGIGIEIRGEDLVVTIARVRPNQTRVAGSLEILNFRERPASEWGAEYNQFLREAGCGHLACTVQLPRAEIIVRQVSLPGVGRKDLAAAVRFQADSLHPYPEDDFSFAWAQIPDTSVVLIGIARRKVVEHYAELFSEAGIRAASFTFSAAVAYTAVRTLASPPAEGFLVLDEREGECEAYGESAARPIFSATFDSPPERVLSLVTAELRLDPETKPVPLLDLLPEPATHPAEWNPSQYAVSYATALAGACPWLALSANLLPSERRSRSSRAVYAPTVALAAVLVLLFGVLGAYGGVQNSGYVSALEKEIAQYTPEAGKVAEIDAEMAKLRDRREVIRKFRQSTKDDLDAVHQLTILLEPPAFLSDLRLEREQITISGEAPEAAQLLAILDDSPHFKNSEFTSPISGSGGLQRFTVRIQREEARPGEGE